MQIHKNEVTTGILVLVSFAIFIVVLVIVGMPGVVEKEKKFEIYFDNAEGIRPGDPVLLAGFKVGKVINIQAPVPENKRPPGHPDFEVCIEVEVSKDAGIYQHVTVHLIQQGLTGQPIIDFVKGDSNSGLAPEKTEFVGERVPDITEAMTNDMERFTGPNSDLAHAIQNVNQLTGGGSDLSQTIANVKVLTAANSALMGTMQNTQQLLKKMNESPIPQIMTNTEQLTDTLKREPWRLFWKATKNYSDEKEYSEKEFSAVKTR
jgi:ABC-type transporter Mla subunit MlaD